MTDNIKIWQTMAAELVNRLQFLRNDKQNLQPIYIALKVVMDNMKAQNSPQNLYTLTHIAQQLLKYFIHGELDQGNNLLRTLGVRAELQGNELGNEIKKQLGFLNTVMQIERGEQFEFLLPLSTKLPFSVLRLMFTKDDNNELEAINRDLTKLILREDKRIIFADLGKYGDFGTNGPLFFYSYINNDGETQFYNKCNFQGRVGEDLQSIQNEIRDEFRIFLTTFKQPKRCLDEFPIVQMRWFHFEDKKGEIKFKKPEMLVSLTLQNITIENLASCTNLQVFATKNCKYKKLPQMHNLQYFYSENDKVSVDDLMQEVFEKVVGEDGQSKLEFLHLVLKDGNKNIQEDIEFNTKIFNELKYVYLPQFKVNIYVPDDYLAQDLIVDSNGSTIKMMDKILSYTNREVPILRCYHNEFVKCAQKDREIDDAASELIRLMVNMGDNENEVKALARNAKNNKLTSLIHRLGERLVK